MGQEKHGNQHGGYGVQVTPGKLSVQARSASTIPSQGADGRREGLYKMLIIYGEATLCVLCCLK